MNTTVMIMEDMIMDIATPIQRAILMSRDTSMYMNMDVPTAPLISRPVFLLVKVPWKISP